MFDFAPPDIEGHGGTPLVVNASLVRLKHDEKELFQKYGIGAFATAYWDSHMVCRMLAKIGHAFAVAELGLDKFSPLLSKLIQTNDDPAAMRFVGGDKTASRTEKPSTLHRLTLGFQKISGKVFVVARIRLFASYGSPIYSVIVGESLDTPMARFKKVLSGRISQYARSSAALR
jgi:hypothetical protein